MDKANTEAEASAYTAVAKADNEEEKFANTTKIIQAFTDDGVRLLLHCWATS